MDSSVSPTHGEQENMERRTCYHPLFVSTSSVTWNDDGVPKPVVERGEGLRIYFRADAGFANPEVYEFLEAERTNTQYGCTTA